MLYREVRSGLLLVSDDMEQLDSGYYTTRNAGEAVLDDALSDMPLYEWVSPKEANQFSVYSEYCEQEGLVPSRHKTLQDYLRKTGIYDWYHEGGEGNA